MASLETDARLELVDDDQRRLRPAVALVVGVLALVAAGVALLALSMHLARSAGHGYGYAIVFLAGLVVLFGPLMALQSAFSTWKREFAVVLAGVASYLPELVRAPTRPYLGDEFVHFRQATIMYRTGVLFPDTYSVPVARAYPGFELVVNTVRELTGLSTYTCGQITVLTVHVAAVVAVYELAKGLGLGRLAGVAAIVFACSPQFITFDTEFSYESLGAPLFVLGLAAACYLSQERDGGRRRWLLGLVAVMVAGAILTHHVSSFALLGCLVVLAVAWYLAPAPGMTRAGALPLGALAVLGLVAALVWSLALHAHLGSYLLSEPENGLRALYRKLTGTASGGAVTAGGIPSVTATRAPLAGAGKPAYELVLAVASPFVWLVVVAAAVWHKRRQWAPAWVLLVALCGSYFALLPFLFVASAQTTAHRSWAFNYVGLAIVGVVGAQVVLGWVRQRVTQRVSKVAGTDRYPLWGLRSGAVVLVAVVATATYGAGPSILSTYPGPLLFESDGRDVPAEVFNLAQWFSANTPLGSVVLSDVRTSAVLDAEADCVPMPQLSADLLLRPGEITLDLQAEIQHDADYVVLDSNLLTQVSSVGYYVDRYEGFHPEPLPASYFNRILSEPWLQVVYRTPHYTVLEVRK